MWKDISLLSQPNPSDSVAPVGMGESWWMNEEDLATSIFDDQIDVFAKTIERIQKLLARSIVKETTDLLFNYKNK